MPWGNVENSAQDLPNQVSGLPSGMKASDLLRTAPHDFYNPNQNQAKHCYAKYNEFFRCARHQGEDHKECQKVKAMFQIMCPSDWTNRWDEQREAGTFAGPQ